MKVKNYSREVIIRRTQRSSNKFGGSKPTYENTMSLNMVGMKLKARGPKDTWNRERPVENELEGPLKVKTTAQGSDI